MNMNKNRFNLIFKKKLTDYKFRIRIALINISCNYQILKSKKDKNAQKVWGCENVSYNEFGLGDLPRYSNLKGNLSLIIKL